MEHYNRKHSKLKGSMKLEHQTGYEVMIDFAGKHLHITDKETGTLIAVEVFVSILPYSHYTYVEACMSKSGKTCFWAMLYNIMEAFPKPSCPIT